MKRVLLLAVLAVLVVGVAGCASVQSGKQLNGMGLTVPNSDAIAHLNGESWGLYFLPIIPLMTGDTSSGGGMAFLSDTCRVEPVVDMVTKSAKEMGAGKVTDMTSSRTSFYIPPFFWYKSVQVSGNAVK